MLIVDLLFIAIIISVLFTRASEKQRWNKGSCSSCGHKWKHFDNTFCGDRGYYCHQCDKYIWISYNVDK